jgi:hypothetical protein
MTYTEKAASLVPNSAARWRAIQNILANINQRNNEQKDYAKDTQIVYVQEKNTPTQIYAKSVKSIKIRRQFNEAA